MKKFFGILIVMGLVALAVFFWPDAIVEREEGRIAPVATISNEPVELTREHVVPADFDWSGPAAKEELLEKIEPLRPREGTVLINEGEMLVTSGTMSEDGSFVFHTFTPKRVAGGIEVTMGKSEIDLSGAEAGHEDKVVALTANQIQLFTSIREENTLSVSMHAEEDEVSGMIALRVTEGFRDNKRE